MARTKVTPRKGERDGETRVLRTRTVTLMAEKEEAPSPVHPSSPAKEVSTKDRRNGEASGRGRAVGGGGAVTIVVAHLTVGPDGCRGQTI